MITVITATRPDRGHLLAEAAESVARQTLAPASWLIKVDHEGQGPATILNDLAKQVTTPWLFRLDDDDILERDHFEHLKPYLCGNRADIIYTWCTVEGPMQRNKFQVPFNADRLAVDNVIPSAAAIKTETWHKLGGYQTDATLQRTRHEDWDLWLRALANNATFLCVPITTWRYRLGNWDHRSL